MEEILAEYSDEDFEPSNDEHDDYEDVMCEVETILEIGEDMHAVDGDSPFEELAKISGAKLLQMELPQ